METPVIIHPAKRVVLLYLSAFLGLLVAFAISTRFLPQQLAIENDIINDIWVALVMIGLSLLSYASLWRLTSKYSISDDCVAADIGILSRDHIRIAIDRITNYRVLRPLFERIIGLGSINISTAGQDDDELIMRQICEEDINLAVLRLNTLLNKKQSIADKAANS